MWFQIMLRIKSGKPRFMHAWDGQAVPPMLGITHLYRQQPGWKKK